MMRSLLTIATAALLCASSLASNTLPSIHSTKIKAPKKYNTHATRRDDGILNVHLVPHTHDGT